MTIIDSQVHAYEANTPKRPWHSVPNWPDHVTGDEMVAAMDKVGVDGAIFISSFSMYRYDASYAVEVQKAHPGRIPFDLVVASMHVDLATSIHVTISYLPSSSRPLTPFRLNAVCDSTLHLFSSLQSTSDSQHLL